MGGRKKVQQSPAGGAASTFHLQKVSAREIPGGDRKTKWSMAGTAGGRLIGIEHRERTESRRFMRSDWHSVLSPFYARNQRQTPN